MNQYVESRPTISHKNKLDCHSHDKKYKFWTTLLTFEPTQIYTITDVWHESYYPAKNNSQKLYTGIPLIPVCLRNSIHRSYRSLDQLKIHF